MLNRRTVLGSLAVMAAGLVTGAVALAANGGLPTRQGMMRRIITAKIDEALDEAKVTADQRAAISASRDRAFAAVDALRKDRAAHMDEALALFQADTIDQAKLDAFHVEHQAEHDKVRAAITQAIVEVHDTLTHDQRKVVADWIRSHRFAMHAMRH